MAIFMLSAFSALVLTASGQKEGTLSLDIKSRKWKHGLSNGLKTRSNEECPSTIFCSPQGKYWHLLSKPERLNSIKSKDSNRGNKKSSSDAKSTKAQGKTKVPQLCSQVHLKRTNGVLQDSSLIVIVQVLLGSRLMKCFKSLTSFLVQETKENKMFRHLCPHCIPRDEHVSSLLAIKKQRKCTRVSGKVQEN